MDRLRKGFGCFDIESSLIEETDEQVFLVAGSFDGDAYAEHYSVADLVDRLSNGGTRVWYAHNLDYDFRFIMEELRTRYNVEVILRGSKALKVVCYRKGREILSFCDSMALAPMSLKSFTSSFCRIHKKADYNILNIKKITDYMKAHEAGFRHIQALEADTKELREYLKLDVVSLHEALLSYKKMFKLKALSLTIGNIAFNSIKKSFDFQSIQASYGLDPVFRKTYAGGRVEVFRNKADDHLYYYDFTSLYPSVMLNDYPTGPVLHKSEIGGKHPFFVAEISTDIPKMYLPPLFLRVGERLVFPTGRIRGWYNSVDINLLDFLNIPYKIHKQYSWGGSAPVFRKWVLDKYRMKEAAEEMIPPNKGLRECAKLQLNACYGKFGERKKRDTFYIPMNQEDAFRKQEECIRNNYFVEEYNPMKDNILHIEEPAYPQHSTTHIASFIASYARAKLYHALYEILQSGHSIYYCDTDSIITDKYMGSPKGLGSLKLEQEIVKDSGYFALPKLYYFTNERGEQILKAKGCVKIRKGDTEDIVSYKPGSKPITPADIEAFVLRRKIIHLCDIRISKQKSIYRGQMKPKECYKHSIDISPGEQKRKMLLSLNDSLPYDTSEFETRKTPVYSLYPGLERMRHKVLIKPKPHLSQRT
jgi:hypothetical protein